MSRQYLISDSGIENCYPTTCTMKVYNFNVSFKIPLNCEPSDIHGDRARPIESKKVLNDVHFIGFSMFLRLEKKSRLFVSRTEWSGLRPSEMKKGVSTIDYLQLGASVRVGLWFEAAQFCSPVRPSVWGRHSKPKNILSAATEALLLFKEPGKNL